MVSKDRFRGNVTQRFCIEGIQLSVGANEKPRLTAIYTRFHTAANIKGLFYLYQQKFIDQSAL